MDSIEFYSAADRYVELFVLSHAINVRQVAEGLQ